MTLADAAVAGARKGRPRDERIDHEITSAALAVLAEQGFDRFSVEEVAQRAGVAKSTLYRRFPARTELIVAALERLNDDLPPAPPPGPVRGRLVEILEGIRRRTAGSPRGRLLMHVIGENAREPGLVDLVHERVLAPRHRLLRGVVADGVASGELRDDIDMDGLLPLLIGPMLYLGMWSMCASTRDVTAESIVDTLLRGLTRANGS